MSQRNRMTNHVKMERKQNVRTNAANPPFNAKNGLQVLPDAALFQPPQNNYADLSSLYMNVGYYGYGWSTGNYYGWFVERGIGNYVNNTVRGIKHTYNSALNNWGVGDTMGIYAYVNTVAPGMTAPSDEGAAGLTVQLTEFQSYFHAAIATTSGTGDTGPTFYNVSGDATPCDGGMMVNLTKGTLSGTMAAHSSNFESYLIQMPITLAESSGDSLPVTTAWGFIDSSIPGTNEDTAEYQTVSKDVQIRNVLSASAPFSIGYARLLGSSFPEMIEITAAGIVESGKQAITFKCRYPNESAYVFQGGLAGQILSFDANLAQNKRRTTHVVAGCLDGENLILCNYLAGFARGDAHIPNSGTEPADPNVTTLAGIHLYPAAENTATITPAGTNPPLVLLEQNNVDWSAGDLVECCPPNYFGGHGAWIADSCSTPGNPSYAHVGLEVSWGGTGKAGSYQPLLLNGENPDEMYRALGGALDKPHGLTIYSTKDTMPCRSAINLIHAPDAVAADPEAALIRVQYDSRTCDGTWRFLSLPHGNSIDYAADAWFGNNERALVIPVTLRVGQLSVGKIRVDDSGSITVPDISAGADGKTAVNKNYADQEIGTNNFTGDIPTSDGRVMHVQNGRIVAVS